MKARYVPGPLLKGLSRHCCFLLLGGLLAGPEVPLAAMCRRISFSASRVGKGREKQLLHRPTWDVCVWGAVEAGGWTLDITYQSSESLWKCVGELLVDLTTGWGKFWYMIVRTRDVKSHKE